jgi:5-methylcytosine-specific restriction endonuclease McrA
VLPLIQLPLFPEGKQCTKCGLVRPFDAFCKDRTRRDGLFPWCRWCKSRSARRQEWDLMRAVGLKWCNRCQQWLLPYLFNKDRSQRDGLQTSCRSCSRARERAYDAAHLDKVREDCRAWYWAHHAEVRARWPEQYRKYAEERRLAARQRYAADPEKHCQRSRRWRERHQEQVKARAKRYQQKNYAFILHLGRRRRARLKGAQGSHTNAEWEALCALYGGHCLCCGRKPDRLTADHVVPLIKGGNDDISNLQPLCRSCNSKKGTHTTDYRPHMTAIVT